MRERVAGFVERHGRLGFVNVASAGMYRLLICGILLVLPAVIPFAAFRQRWKPLSGSFENLREDVLESRVHEHRPNDHRRTDC